MNMAVIIDSFEQLTTRIGRLQMRRCGPIPALTIFVVYTPTSTYEEEEVESFYNDLEKLYREDYTLYKVIIGDFSTKIGLRRTHGELHIGTHGLQSNEKGERLSEFIMTTKTIHENSQFQKPYSLRWTWESPGGESIIDWELFISLVGFFQDTVMDNIDDEYARLVGGMRRVSKPPRDGGAARAASNQELMSELARFCREALKEDLKERRAEVLAEAAKVRQSIRYAHGTITASRRGMKNVIHNFYSDFFDSHVYLPPYHLREDGHVIPKVLPSEVRHAIMLVKNRTSPSPNRIRPEQLKNLPPVLIKYPGEALYTLPV
ncbi:hypothetical protein RB195_001542 [Necator americanus]|uniref:PAZ domain-containing protein n=1 Tax=Necator americanus TaxID=51031 RepID=A0ABR1DGD9_NECAM